MSSTVVTTPPESVTGGRHPDTLSIRNNALVVLVATTLLTLVPLLITAQLDPLRLLEHAAFGIFLAACIVFYSLVLAKYRTLWSQVLSLLGIWGLTIAFNALFSYEFGNAYLAYIVAVQVVFALLGPRYGTAMLALSIAGAIADTLAAGGDNIGQRAFMLSVLVAVGVLTWVFVYAGKVASERAILMAAQANLAKEEAERLAREVTRLNRVIRTSQDNERRRLARDIHDGPLL